MSEIVKLIFKHFEGFIKRAILPSVTFLFFYIVLYLIFGKNYDTKMIPSVSLPTSFGDVKFFIFIILFIGMSYFLSILQQAVFDNWIKKNYTEESSFKDLREKVIDKLSAQEEIVKQLILTDYLLYQILGKHNDKLDRYVDETKAIGITFISLMINCGLSAFLLFEKYQYTVLFSIPIIILLFCIGYDLTKKKYQSRAIRLYVNYLFHS